MPARLRTIVVVPKEDRDDVVRRIDVALRDDERWQLEEFEVRAVAEGEEVLARRLKQS